MLLTDSPNQVSTLPNIIATLDRQQILAIIPHGPKFCFLDSFELVSGSNGIIGIGRLTVTDDHCFDHFQPPNPLLFPGVYHQEMILQTGLVRMFTLCPELAHNIGMPKDNVTYSLKGPVIPGQTMVSAVELCPEARLSSRNGRGFGTTTVNGLIVATCEFSFTIKTLEDTNRMIAIQRRRSERELRRPS